MSKAGKHDSFPYPLSGYGIDQRSVDPGSVDTGITLCFYHLPGDMLRIYRWLLAMLTVGIYNRHSLLVCTSGYSNLTLYHTRLVCRRSSLAV
jgi:hypothetical protein